MLLEDLFYSQEIRYDLYIVFLEHRKLLSTLLSAFHQASPVNDKPPLLTKRDTPVYRAAFQEALVYADQNNFAPSVIKYVLND